MTVETRVTWLNDFSATANVLSAGDKLVVRKPTEWVTEEREKDIPLGYAVPQPPFILEVLGDDAIKLTPQEEGQDEMEELRGDEINEANLSFAPVPGSVNFLGKVIYQPKQ